MAAASEFALKPKLLRSLRREYVPDEKHPFKNHSDLSYVVSTIRTHKLLSESAPEAVEKDVVEDWRSAVDSWVHRLLALTSSNLPDKCWAGICLLGVTCQECSSERFLASYAEWLNKLLSHIQTREASHFVKAASCASLSDLFSRLSEFSTAKKDGTSQATKVVEAAIKLLNEDSSSVVLEEAICLLCTLINFFPLPIHQHYDRVESAIVLKLMSEECCDSLLKKLGYGLSLLPKSRGDENSWSLMMEKILICVNIHLNELFQGLEEEDRSTEMTKALRPSGKEPAPLLGGIASYELYPGLSEGKRARLLGSRISTLTECCCNMLTSSYPVKVPIPIRALAALAGRVLKFDGSFSLSSYSFMLTLKEEHICSEIPGLQLRSLEILAAVVKGLSSQLLPHVAYIVQLLTEYLRICKFTDLRIKAYSILKCLLMSMGVGFAIHVSQDVVSIVFSDLDYYGHEKDGKSSGMHSKVQRELLKESRQKKRKHSSTTQPLQQQHAREDLEVDVPLILTPISVKMAALETLEALLIVGGSMRSESWRGNVDNLLISLAKNACNGGWSKDERNIFVSGDSASVRADFQLAALRALLASLLSPGRERPPHLALSVDLFRRGAEATGTKVGEYCGRALFALEVLIHPRALPLLNAHSSINDFNILGVKQIPTYQTRTLGKGHDEPESEDDDLNENWPRIDDDLESQGTGAQQNIYSEKPSSLEERPPARDSSIVDFPVESAAKISPSTPREKNTDKDDLMTLDNLGAQSGIGASDSVQLEPMSKRRITGMDSSAERDSGALEEEIASASEELVSETTESKIIERISGTISSNIEKTVEGLFGSDSELGDDPFPDIIDGDPDSD